MRVAPALFAVAWNGNEFTPLLPLYRQSVGLSQTAVYILLGMYVVGIVPGLMIGGPASDRFGRRRVMLPAPFIAALGSVCIAVGAHWFPLMYLGRALCGLALGFTMAVGTAWAKELSQAPHERFAPPAVGAKRASLSLTAGFTLGAAVAAVLAQWGPWPTALPFVLAACLAVAAGLWQLPTIETAGLGVAEGAPSRMAHAMRIPSAFSPRFLAVVATTAGWVFATNGVAYAILPTMMQDQVSGWPVAYFGLMNLLTLGTGFVTQQIAGRFAPKPGTRRGLGIAMGVTVVSLGLAVVAAATRSIPLCAVVAVCFGVSYGLLLLGGLREVQAVAAPQDLGGLTGVFYSIAYLGFFVPTIVSLLEVWVSVPMQIAVLGVIAVGGFVCVMRFGRVPARRDAER